MALTELNLHINGATFRGKRGQDFLHCKEHRVSDQQVEGVKKFRGRAILTVHH